MSWRGFAWDLSRRFGRGWFPFMGGEMILPLEAIKQLARHRQDMGDVASLAKSIASKGLLHPIVVTPDNVLIAGGRRLAACKRLGWKEVPVTVARNFMDAQTLLEAERDENTCRQDLKPSEKATLGMALEDLERPRARARQRAAQNNTSSENFTELVPSENGNTRDLVAKAVGMSGPTYTRAKLVVKTANDESLSDEVRAVAVRARKKMDDTGSVVGAYNLVAPLLDLKPQVYVPPAVAMAPIASKTSTNGSYREVVITKKDGTSHTRRYKQKGRNPKDAALGAIATVGSLATLFRELDVSAISYTEEERVAWEGELAEAVSAIQHFRRQLKGVE